MGRIITLHTCLLICVLGFVACTEGEKVKLTKIDELRFRRSYLDTPAIVNPVLEDVSTKAEQALKAELENKGLVKDGKLLMNVLEALPVCDTVHLSCKKGEHVSVSVELDTLLKSEVLVVKGNDRNDRIKLDAVSQVRMYELDLDNDGFNEVIVFNEFYLMNGDSYCLSVYKLK